MKAFQAIVGLIKPHKTAILLLVALAGPAVPLNAQSLTPAKLVFFHFAKSISTSQIPLKDGEALKSLTANLGTTAAIPYNRNENWESPRVYAHNSSGLEDMVEFSETPFVQQVRLPIGSLFGGRISFSGFNSVTPMENIEQGLPGSGSLSALSSMQMGHVGMRLARDDNRYGFSLTLHHAGGEENDLRQKLGRSFGRLFGKNI